VAVLPCVGSGAHEYRVTEAQAAAWATAYPGVDIAAEVRRMAVWLEANPTKRKTARGAPRFAVAWLGRAQDRGRTHVAPAGARAVPLRDWGRLLTPEERDEFRRRRAELAPAMDPEAPWSATGWRDGSRWVESREVAALVGEYRARAAARQEAAADGLAQEVGS
jgi:hypothetical protein